MTRPPGLLICQRCYQGLTQNSAKECPQCFKFYHPSCFQIHRKTHAQLAHLIV